MKPTSAALRKIKRRRRKLFLFSASLVLVLALCYLFVWQRVYSLELAKDHARYRQIVTKLEEKCRALECEVSKLAAMRRIETLAEQRLGLKPMHQGQIKNYKQLLPSPESNSHSDSINFLGESVVEAAEIE